MWVNGVYVHIDRRALIQRDLNQELLDALPDFPEVLVELVVELTNADIIFSAPMLPRELKTELLDALPEFPTVLAELVLDMTGTGVECCNRVIDIRSSDVYQCQNKRCSQLVCERCIGLCEWCNAVLCRNCTTRLYAIGCPYCLHGFGN